MSKFYLYLKRHKTNQELSHCERVEVTNVIKMDKIFIFNVFFHSIRNGKKEEFICTEVNTGFNFCKSDLYEDCVKQFEEIKASTKLKDVALAMGRAKSLVEGFRKV